MDGESNFRKVSRILSKNILNKSSSLKVSKTTNSFSTSYKYIVNGTIINFNQKPKSITIGKSEFVVDI